MEGHVALLHGSLVASSRGVGGVPHKHPLARIPPAGETGRKKCIKKEKIFFFTQVEKKILAGIPPAVQTETKKYIKKREKEKKIHHK